MNKNPIPLFKVFMSEEAAENSKKYCRVDT